jgi:hypothetical protein
VPAARRESEKNLTRSLHVEMERLWIEFSGKGLDARLVDNDPPRAEGLSHGKVVKISRCLSSCPLTPICRRAVHSAQKVHQYGQIHSSPVVTDSRLVLLNSLVRSGCNASPIRSCDADESRGDSPLRDDIGGLHALDTGGLHVHP